jgi:phage shock protein A
MGLLERIKSLVRANLNEILRRAEDPEQALDQLIKTMEADLAEARAGVATAVRDERKLHDNHEYQRQQAQIMLQRATTAVKRDDDELAKAALRRRRRHQLLAESLREQWDVERDTLGELRASLEGLEGKIEQARRKKEALLARRRLARVRRELQEQAGVGRAAATDRTFGRFEDRVDDLEAEAAAYAELGNGDVATQIERLEKDATADEREIEAELQDIKDRLKKGD